MSTKPARPNTGLLHSSDFAPLRDSALLPSKASPFRLSTTATASWSSRIRRTLPCLETTDPERPPPALPSELLEEIFLRVASPADLARASTACVSFRHVIIDPSFLRRYRSIHPPPLLGLVSDAGFTPVDAPHPSAALARAIGRAANFSFDYLPRPDNGHEWLPCDVSHGRVLVKCSRNHHVVHLDIAVCDPLSRRYRQLPPMTRGQFASVGFQGVRLTNPPFVSFLPSGGVEETAFSVISWINCSTRLAVFTFTSSSGRWSVGTSTSRDDLGLHGFSMLHSVQCVYGHIYWKPWCTSKLIKLDMNSMEFSTVNLPPDHDRRDTIIVESCGSKIAMFSVNPQLCQGRYVDYYTLSQNGNEKSHEWHMMSTIPVPTDYIIGSYIKGPHEGYIILGGILTEQDAENLVFLSLEIKSFKIERVCTSRFGFLVCPYFGFPPSMSSIRIQ